MLATRHQYHFEDLSPDDFERLVHWLVKHSSEFDEVQWYGGARDKGRDVVAYKHTAIGREKWYIQCKRYQSIAFPMLRDELDKLAQHTRIEPGFAPNVIVFATACPVPPDAKDKAAAHADDLGLPKPYYWGRLELDEMLKAQPETEAEFFGSSVQYHFTFQVAPFRPPPDLAVLRATYTDYLLSAHRYLDFKGVPQVEKVATLLPLEEVFVPLHARPTAPEADTWRRPRLAGRDVDELEEMVRLEGMMASVESAGPVPIDEALNREPALVILGDPGAGKSALVKHLALHLARDSEGPLPILLPLNAYAEVLQREEIGLQAYLARYYGARRKGLEGVGALFDAALAEGQAVVLLDGLDEVQERRAYVNRLVEDFVAAHSRRAHRPFDGAQGRGQKGNRFVVTSRIVGYQDASLSSMLGGASWPVYTLIDWGWEEIERFAALWTLAFEIATRGDTPEARTAAEEERQDLLAAIVPGSGIERLASNPLLLTIMALIKRQRVTLPRERVRLYELYLETLISAWNKARTLDKRPVGPEISYLETVQVLAPLALWLREESPTAGLVGRGEIEDWLTGYYQRDWGEPRGPARQRARAFLESVRGYSNLLVERGEGRYGFLHLTLEEMLAAKGIAL